MSFEERFGLRVDESGIINIRGVFIPLFPILIPNKEHILLRESSFNRGHVIVRGNKKSDEMAKEIFYEYVNNSNLLKLLTDRNLAPLFITGDTLDGPFRLYTLKGDTSRSKLLEVKAVSVKRDKQWFPEGITSTTLLRTEWTEFLRIIYLRVYPFQGKEDDSILIKYPVPVDVPWNAVESNALNDEISNLCSPIINAATATLEWSRPTIRLIQKKSDELKFLGLNQFSECNLWDLAI